MASARRMVSVRRDQLRESGQRARRQVWALQKVSGRCTAWVRHMVSEQSKGCSALPESGRPSILVWDRYTV
jgi:hypothetical protein